MLKALRITIIITIIITPFIFCQNVNLIGSKQKIEEKSKTQEQLENIIAYYKNHKIDVINKCNSYLNKVNGIIKNKQVIENNDLITIQNYIKDIMNIIKPSDYTIAEIISKINESTAENVTIEDISKAINLINQYLLTVNNEIIQELEQELEQLKKDKAIKPQESKIQIAVPAGATSGVATSTSKETSSAGALIGFQLWKGDDYFLSAMYKRGIPTTIKGEKSDYGSFILNPTTDGSSFIFANNVKLFDLLGEKHPIMVSFSSRTTITFTTWTGESTDSSSTGNTSDIDSCDGYLLAFTPAIQIKTSTYTASEDQNEYQMGLEISYGLRKLGGDLSKEFAKSFRSSLIGSENTFFYGWEFVLFARVQSVCPFIRVTYFKGDGENEIRGLSKFQAYIGVEVVTSVLHNILE